MNEISEDGSTMLLRGDRLPNFTLPATDGRTLLFYETATGGPMLIGACGPDWDAAARESFSAAIRELSVASGYLSLLLCDESSDASFPGDESNRHIALVDADARLRVRLFGPVLAEGNGVCAITDANLRLLDGCEVSAAELSDDRTVPAIREMITEAREELAQDDAETMAAPVLIVPRVLPADLCTELCRRFAEWNPADSPLPRDDGGALEIDAARKSRRDVTIDDAALEQEVIACIARRVLPEVSKAFHYRATRFERLKLVSYAADASGHFAPHRDNTAPTTAHRRFALTLNLNTGRYDGGALAFPEYGESRRYAPPAGGAIVFSCSHAHRVTPVTRGERYALVSFFSGEEGGT
jgi:predicted 2-oxoglutarate/Fe(II)-dependent dioxygenase YbiX